MDIVIISKDSTYKELFLQQEDIKVALRWDDLKKPTIDIDVVFLDGEVIDIHQFSSIREQFPTIPVFYKPKSINSDQIMKNVSRVCAAHKITMLSEHLTPEQVVTEVINKISNKSDYLSKRIISFFGTHSGAGVSTTVFNLARSLSQKVDERVLVLSLNSWDPADYFYHYNGHYLNDLKVDLKTNSLTPFRLQEAVSFNLSFYHLAGNRDIKMQRFYQPYEIEHLIKVAQEVFDVILIDAGTHFDTAPTVQAYLSSNLKFLVTNQEEKGYRGYFPYVYQQLIEPIGGKSEEFMLVINKFQPANTLISEKSLEDELEMTKAVTLPDVGDLGAISAYQKRLLYDDISDSHYTKNLDLLSNLIISECQLKEKVNIDTDRKEKKGLFSLFK
ncbi:hypothetical protein AWM68_17880 [Fictibacillus phosphorivorans]|uniref:ParA family protein n=1 Tax=Fictibacillus phosphorivorans TaxID=1221500 RepID=A0A165NXE1_9BACL|nr:hypothetical protein [Fictibacillus phosphorivorans]KZE68040.1 hypothetical protein AWM68_17880 [Fictibacillus phosphorivorans]